MAYDQAQSARLGQPTAVESTYVRMFSGDELPEVSWTGQLIFRSDSKILQVFDGTAWEDVAGGVAGQLTFVGPDEPVANAIGDTWYDSDDGHKQYLWTGAPPDGQGWVVVTAAGGNKTTPGPNPPVGPAIGDGWLSTVDWQLYTWDGVRWQPIKVPKAELNARYALGMSKAVEKLIPPNTEAQIVVYYRDTTPSGASSNDLWVRTTDASLYRYDGSSWNQIIDPSIIIPISLAGEPRSITDEQISLYYASSPPSGLDGQDIGDLWTDAGGLLRGWSGADWLPLQATADDIAPGAVNTIHIVDHAIKTPQLADFAVGTFQISDFAIPVKKMVSTTHMIY